MARGLQRPKASLAVRSSPEYPKVAWAVGSLHKVPGAGQVRYVAERELMFVLWKRPQMDPGAWVAATDTGATLGRHQVL